MHTRIPTLRRDLRNCIDPTDDICPIWLKVRRLREYACHADDRDVERRQRGRFITMREPSGYLIDESARADGDLPMECINGRRRRAQRRYLTDHHHPLCPLIRFISGDNLLTAPAQAFARQAQAAEVELFELHPDRLLGNAFRTQTILRFVEGANVWRLCAARGVSR